MSVFPIGVDLTWHSMFSGEGPIGFLMTYEKQGKVYFRHLTDIFPIYSILGMEKETKNERFRRLAASRGDRLIREIQLLGNLSNRKNYSYNTDEVERLFGPIEEELQRVRRLFGDDMGTKGRIRFDDE